MSLHQPPFEVHQIVTENDICTIDFIAQHCPQLSKQKLKMAMQAGALWLTRANHTSRLRRAKRILNPGDHLHLYYNEAILLAEITPAILVADEGEYSIWNKPCGMFSQGTKWGDHSSICRWVEQVGLNQRQAFLVHRLDRATSGLIIVAHQKKIASRLAAMFEHREVVKHYRASVTGEFLLSEENCNIESPIDDKDAQTIILKALFEPHINQSHLRLTITTGRKHQIRKHLSSIGFPIIGDRLYGGAHNDEIIAQHSQLKSRKAVEPDLQLQSCYLKFACPISGIEKEYTL